MALLDKAALLAEAAKPLPIEKVSIPELGGDVYIRAMSGSERDAWERSLIVGRGKRRDVDTTNVRAKLVVRVLCDDTGARLMADSDAEALGHLRVDILTKLYEVAQRMSGVTDKDVEELGKDSAPADGSGSPTN